eukprot:scaffold2967_cov102-Skeletonema_marinoi.AAC.2
MMRSVVRLRQWASHFLHHVIVEASLEVLGLFRKSEELWPYFCVRVCDKYVYLCPVPVTLYVFISMRATN